MILLFDFGGVIVDLDLLRCVSAFGELGFDVLPNLGNKGQTGLLERFESGHIDTPQFCDAVRELSGNAAATDEQIVHAWQQFLVGVPEERLELLLRIRRHYPTAVLSNTNPVHWAQARDGFFRYKGLGVEDFFRHTFLSYEMGVMKPQAEIYEKVIESLGVPASEIVFFDDLEANCEAARAAGMKAVCAPLYGKWARLFTEDGRLKDEQLYL